MFDFSQVKNWDYKTLKEWLKDPSTQEGWDYDFKSQLPNSRNKCDKDNLRATFCSFANSNDGLIFFGISDEQSAVGIPYDQNFQTKVSAIISRKISPPIRNWSIFHSIRINNNNFVYVVLIRESLYTDKPHMINCKVWIRENGHRREINNGIELQRLFFLPEKYYPQYDELTIRVFERIKRSTDATVPFLDNLLLQKLKIYLEDSCKDNNKKNGYLPLLGIFSKIEKELPRLRRSFLESIIEGNNRAFLDAKNQLEKLIGEFLNKFEKIK